MGSPNKKKLKSGVRSTVGGKLGGTSYKTASPYSIKTNNMNTNGLSPLMQAAVGGEKQTIPGQDIYKGTGDNYKFDPGDGSEIEVMDPDDILEVADYGIVDNDYLVEEDENGNLIIKGVADVSKGEEFEEGVPGTPAGPGAGAGAGIPQGGM